MPSLIAPGEAISPFIEIEYTIAKQKSFCNTLPKFFLLHFNNFYTHVKKQKAFARFFKYS